MTRRLPLGLLLALAALALIFGLRHALLRCAVRQAATARSAVVPVAHAVTSALIPSPTCTDALASTATATCTRTPSVPPLALPSATHTPTALPTLSTAAWEAQVEVPARDLYALTERLRGVEGPIPRFPPGEPISHAVGDQETFWLSNLDLNETFAIRATLRHVSPHLYLWVEEGAEVDDAALAASAREFEEQIYPANRRYFGSEWTPGVDGDVHLHVLNAYFSGAAGYYSSADEYPRTVNPYSNQREMFYINLHHRTPGTTAYYATLAHEFQHMIHWHADPNEDAWVNEGASELAEVLNGYAEPEIANFARHPDVQLNDWSYEELAGAHYDASYLWTAYFVQCFGPEMLREVVQHPANGIAGYAAVLAAHNNGLAIEDLFADWVIANYLDDPTLAGGRYGYAAFDLPDIVAQEVHRAYPITKEATVQQFGTDYIELYCESGSIQIAFTGTLTVPLLPNQAHSGRYQWWSNRGDNSAMTLTRAFDLTGLAKATLRFALWYDIEDNWDYGYVEISTDGGRRWHTLPGRYTTERNPNGESFGHGYTGKSGGQAQPRWVEETMDLTPYTGSSVLIRFEYITDDAVHHAGLCLDDIRIPELGYAHDAESGDDGWIAEGFLRTDNVLPQRFLVQLVTLGRETAVQRLPLDANGRTSAVIRSFGQDVNRAVLVVSGLTPMTTEAGRYSYHLIAGE